MVSWSETYRDGGSRLKPWRGTLDGLRGNPEDSVLAAWRKRALADDRHGAHPALYHDWGRRLASQIAVDVTQVDRFQGLPVLVWVTGGD